MIRLLGAVLAFTLTGSIVASAATVQFVSAGATGSGTFEAVYAAELAPGTSGQITIAAPDDPGPMVYSLDASQGGIVDGSSSGVLLPGNTEERSYSNPGSTSTPLTATFAWALSTWNALPAETQASILGTTASSTGTPVIDLDVALPDLEADFQAGLVAEGLDPADFPTFAEIVGDDAFRLTPDATPTDAVVAVVALDVIRGYAADLGVAVGAVAAALNLTDPQLATVASELESLGTPAEVTAAVAAVVAEINAYNPAVGATSPSLIAALGLDGSFNLDAGLIGDDPADSVRRLADGGFRIDGQTIGLAPVPLPAAAWLLLASVGGLMVLRRRQRAVA